MAHSLPWQALQNARKTEDNSFGWSHNFLFVKERKISMTFSQTKNTLKEADKLMLKSTLNTLCHKYKYRG